MDGEGFYDIAVILASQDGSHKENPVLLDGDNIGATIVEGKDFTGSVLSRVYLLAGEHVIRLGTSWGWVKIDAVELTPSPALPDDLYQVEPVLVNPNPSPEAQNLFNWLCECYGKKIITGQFCDGGMLGLENQAVWRATGGSYPALLGLDLGDYTPSRVEHGAVGHAVDHAIEYWDKGGIVTPCWHWNAPSPYLTDEWYSGFYTEHTTFDLGKVMTGEDPKGYELLLRDIDAIAAQLTRLRDAGDETVDMIGEDIYAGERVYASQSAKFVECLSYTDARKMMILSENGCVPDPDLLFRDGTVWGSFCTWGGDFVLKSAKFNNPSERYTEKWLLQKMYSDERVVTRADIPDLKAAPEP